MKRLKLNIGIIILLLVSTVVLIVLPAVTSGQTSSPTPSFPVATLPPPGASAPAPSPLPSNIPVPSGAPVVTSITAEISPPGAAPAPSSSGTPSPSPSAAVSPSPTPSVTLTGSDIKVTISVANLNIVNKIGAANATGEGHINYFLDVAPPTEAGKTAVGLPGSFASTADLSYTWKGVGAGVRGLFVELVNNDDTPFQPAAVAGIFIVVPEPNSQNPGIASISGQSGAAVSPSASPSSSASPAASPSASPSTAASGNSVTISIKTTNFTVKPPANASPGAAASPSASPSPSSSSSASALPSPAPSASRSPAPSASPGAPGAPGTGYIKYYLNPASGQAPGTSPGVAKTVPSGNQSYTWTGLSPGMHVLGVELVDSNGQSFNPAVWGEVVMGVPGS